MRGDRRAATPRPPAPSRGLGVRLSRGDPSALSPGNPDGAPDPSTRQGAASRRAKRPPVIRDPVSVMPAVSRREGGVAKELPILSPCSITNPRHSLREPVCVFYLMRAIIHRLPGADDVAESVPPAEGPRSETKKLPPATCVKFSISPLPARTLAAAFQP